VIGPGWLPRPPQRQRRPTLAYTRKRRCVRAIHDARSPSAVNNDAMLFDQRPTELPVATLRSHSWRATIASDFRRWTNARWRWLAPRTVPVLVAMIGMVALLASAHYLSNLAMQPPERVENAPVVVDSDQLAAIKINVGPPGAIIYIDGQARTFSHLLEMPASGSQIKLIHPSIQPSPR
jgi:hypothetical protein